MFSRLTIRRALIAALLAAGTAPFALTVVRAQTPATLQGTLTIVWGDPKYAGAASRIFYMLATADGQHIPLQVDLDANEMLRHQRKSVTVRGRAGFMRNATGGAGQAGVIVESISENHQAEALAQPTTDATVSGAKKVLFLLLQFSDDVAVPHAPSFYLNMMNPDVSPDPNIPSTINAFFKKVSGNTFSWSGDVGGAGGVGAPGGWIKLPNPKSYYANCSFNTACLDFSHVQADAGAAVTANGIDLTQYDTVNLVFSNDLDCCSWGGGVFLNGRSYAATYEPPWGQVTSTYTHELGHSLGLPHSGWLYYSYDSPWDTMSSIQSGTFHTCGSYSSRNDNATEALFCDEPGDGYIAGHRDYLGWVPNQVSINSTTSGQTVTLEANSIPAAGNPKLIKICLPGYSCSGSGSTTRYFTVEARVKNGGATTQYDNAIPGDGVIIHDFWFGRQAISGGCYFNNQSGWAVPVDSTPGDFNSSSCSYAPGTALFNAQFGVGSTYTNSTYAFKVNVLSRSGNNFVVSVQTTITTQINMDAPVNGSAQTKPLTITGWAINRTATAGTGIDLVHVYATPIGGSAVFLGVATYGSARSDIGAIYGSQFTNCGWTLSGAGGSLTPGTYTITAFAHNASTGAFDAAANANISVSGAVSKPAIAVDTPTAGQTVTSAFEVGGWALDAGAPAGTGVDGVTFYVQPAGAPAPGIFIGTGSYGAARGDVAALYGSRFTAVGFHFTITGMSPGTFTLNVIAHDTLTNSNSIVKSVPFTVSATALMSIDVPSAEATIAAATFTIGGWSIDRTVEGTTMGGSGVDAVHIYAFPNPGSGQAPIFLGVATLGVSRPDVGAFYGSRYGQSGYNLTVNRGALGLGPGVYNIAVVSHSSVSGTFTNTAVVRVTLQ